MKTSKNSQKSQSDKKYFIKTFGCQMNVSDSERIAGFLEKNNFQPVAEISEAALVIFNTCGVRQMAEDRVYGQIHNLKAKSQKLKAKIILTGCLANRKDVQRRLKDKVDLFCEIKNFPEKFSRLVIPSEPRRTEGSNLKKIDSSTALRSAQNDNNGYLKIIPKYNTRYSAFVPIMTGCDNFCAYCVVPYARGREVSRPAAEIISEVKNLVKKGCKEIVLLGQNVNSYKDGKINFSRLLRRVDAVPGNFWIQFISNHPKDVTDEMIETAASLPKICESFHLPLQAGADAIIRRMNRKYTRKKYLGLVDKIKKAYAKYKPGSLYSVTSDIIVGFPSETRKQFMDSAEVMKKVGFDMVYFGQFSRRPGTAAFSMKDNVSKAEKVRRERFLNEILKKTSFANNKKYVGTIQEVLIENKKDGFYFGRTRTGKNVRVTIADFHPEPCLPAGRLVEGSKNPIGKIVGVKITKANIWNLEGKIK